MDRGPCCPPRKPRVNCGCPRVSGTHPRTEDLLTKRLRITPFQRGILRTLEEAGEETLGSVLNTLRTSPEENLEVGWEFRDALNGLIRLGFVSWSPESADSDALLLARFDPDSQSWSAPPMCSIHMTVEGRRALTR